MFKVDLDRSMIMLDSSCYCLYDRVLEYALNHRFNVKCTEVRSSIFAETCLAFQKAGYKVRFEEEHKNMFGCDIVNLVAVFYLDEPKIRNLDKVLLEFLTNLMQDALNAGSLYAAEKLSSDDLRSSYIQGCSDTRDRMLREMFHAI